MDKSSNPALSNKAFARYDSTSPDGTMTVAGTLKKAGLAFVVLLAASAAGWYFLPQLLAVLPWWVMLAGILGTLAVGIWAAFRANAFNVLLYAALEGLYIGIVSRFFETLYDGIVSQAIILTLAVTAGMFILYSTGLVKVTKKFRSVMLIATVGILIYLVSELIIGLFVPGFLNLVTSGVTGIVIAAIIVLVAALNLLLDFDTITRGVEQRLNKKAEWFASFGLMVTLIWLYLSILRLLAASRR